MCILLLIYIYLQRLKKQLEYRGKPETPLNNVEPFLKSGLRTKFADFGQQSCRNAFIVHQSVFRRYIEYFKKNCGINFT